MRRITLYLNPYLGKMPINVIEAQDLLTAVKPVVDRGKLVLARKLLEMCGRTWDEIDFENAEWRIPAERMKMKETHIVPLSRQALELFREMHKLSGNFKYVFPSTRHYRIISAIQHY